MLFLFFCVSRAIKKIWQDGTEGMLVVPDWPNQIWYSLFSHMIAMIPPRPSLFLSRIDPGIYHPLHLTLQLGTTEIFQKLQKQHTTHKERKICSWHLGHSKHGAIIIHILENGQNIAIKLGFQSHIRSLMIRQCPSYLMFFMKIREVRYSCCCTFCAVCNPFKN